VGLTNNSLLKLLCYRNSNCITYHIQIIQGSNEIEESVDDTFMNKVHTGAITDMTFVEGSLLSVGWDDKLRLTSEKLMRSNINLEAQPNKIATETSLVVIVTVNSVLLVKGNNALSDLIQILLEPFSVCVSNDGTMHMLAEAIVILFSIGNDGSINRWDVTDDA